MNIFILTLPVAFLVATSQILIKWRFQSYLFINSSSVSFERFNVYFLDPLIVLAYLLSLVASIFWLMLIPRIHLSIGFPIYIGSTFFLVLLGSFLILGESLSLIKLFSVILILSGIILGSIN